MNLYLSRLRDDGFYSGSFTFYVGCCSVWEIAIIIGMDAVFSNLLLVDECLLDEKRIREFKSAIRKSVRPGDIVVDAGTGSGIIALFAARAGAKKVYALELDPYIAKIAEHNIKVNKLEHIIEVINIDVRKFRLPRGEVADVLTMEMLDTGLIAEHQAGAIIKLRKNKVINDKTRLLPERALFYAAVIDYDFNFYGFQMPLIVQARNDGVLPKIKHIMSPQQCYNDVDLRKIKSIYYSGTMKLKILKSGVVNAIKLSTVIFLHGKRCSATSDMNMPTIIPIKSRQVKKNDIIELEMKYAMGMGFGGLRVKG